MSPGTCGAGSTGRTSDASRGSPWASTWASPNAWGSTLRRRHACTTRSSATREKTSLRTTGRGTSHEQHDEPDRQGDDRPAEAAGQRDVSVARGAGAAAADDGPPDGLPEGD